MVTQLEISKRRDAIPEDVSYVPNPPLVKVLGREVGQISTALGSERGGWGKNQAVEGLRRYIERISRYAPEAEPFDSDLEFDSTGMAEIDGLVIYDSSRDQNPFGIPRDLPVE